MVLDVSKESCRPIRTYLDADSPLCLISTFVAVLVNTVVISFRLTELAPSKQCLHSGVENGLITDCRQEMKRIISP